MSDPRDEAPGVTARGLLGAATAACLGTIVRHGGARDGGGPYTSLVLVAVDAGGAPVLLLSDLAEHSQNIAGDDRVSLLIDGTQGLEDRLTGPRLTLLGRAARSADPDHRAGYLARHPSAERYADFGDFAFYRVTIDSAHLVAGFGKIHAIAGADLLNGA